MELSKKLPLLRYWKVEDILSLINDLENEENEVSVSILEQEISNALESGELITHKASSEDKLDYLDKNIFSEWFYNKFNYVFSTYLQEPSIAFMTLDEPDYTHYSQAVFEDGKLSLKKAFCFLEKIPTSLDKKNWTLEQKENYQRFLTFVPNEKKLSPKDVLVIAEKANLAIPEEMLIPIEQANKFSKKGLDIDQDLQNLLNDLHAKHPNLSHEQLCARAEGDPKAKGKTAGRIVRLTRSPKGKLVKLNNN